MRTNENFELEQVLIDGRKANIITCYADYVPERIMGMNYIAVLFVPNIGNERGHLTMLVYNRSTENQSLSKKIFETVRFIR